MSIMNRFFVGGERAPRRLGRALVHRYLAVGFCVFAAISAGSENASAAVTLRKGLPSNPLKPQDARNYLSYEDCLLRGEEEYEFDASPGVQTIYLGIASDYDCLLSDGSTPSDDRFKTACLELKSADLSDNKHPKISVHNLVESYAAIPGTGVDSALCLDTSAEAKPYRPMQLFFKLTDGTVSIWKDSRFDLSPPDAPTVSSVNSDEGMLFINYDTNDNDARFVHVFCEPVTLQSSSASSSSGTGGSSTTGSAGAGGTGGNGGAGGNGSAGAGGAGGAGGTGTAGGTAASSSSGSGSSGTNNSNEQCNPIVLTQDMSTPSAELPYLQSVDNRKILIEKNLCAQVQEHTASRTSVSATHYVYVDNPPDANQLKNGQDYLVRIAIRDEAGNFGMLSEPKCGTPEDLATFTDELAKAGAKAGGGYCQCDFMFNSDVLPLYSYGGAAALFGLWYRRRKRAAAHPERRSERRPS